VHRIRALVAAHFGGLPAQFWWLWVGALVSSLATFVFLFLAVYLTSLGLSPERVGLTASVFGFGALAAGPVSGTLSDRLGRKATLVGALVAAGAAAAWLGFVRTPALVVPGVFAFGFAATSAYPALHAMVADVVPEPDRPRAFGLLYWANNIGISLSAVVGGIVGSRSWLALFLADGATALAFAAIVWLRVREPGGAPRPAEPRPEGEGAGSGWRAVLSDRGFVAFVGTFVLFLGVFFQFQTGLPIAMTHAGFGPDRIGRVLAVNGLLIGTLQPFAAKLTAGRSPAKVLAAGALLVGGGYAAYALCGPLPAWGAATALWTLGEIATMPSAAALVNQLAPPALRGRYNGLFSLSFGAGQAIAPLAGGALLGRAGATALFATCGATCAVVAAAHLALGRARPDR
jgi:MFS family permease